MPEDERLSNLEHTVEKADDDLTALTKDVEALKRDNAEIKALLRSLADAVDCIPEFMQPLPNTGPVAAAKSKFNTLLQQVKAKAK